jgi:hypothetical protein
MNAVEHSGGALARIETYDSIITLDEARQLIAQCQNLEDLKAIHDEADARAAYAEAKGMCAEVQNSLWTIKQLAEQELSKLLSAAKRGKTGPKQLGSTVLPNSEYTQEREAAGITKNDASDWREAEHIPAETVVEYAQEAAKTKEKPTRKKLVGYAKSKGIRKPIKVKSVKAKASKAPTKSRRESLGQPGMEDAIVALTKLPQPFPYKKIHEMGYGKRSLPLVARHMPWLRFEQISGTVGSGGDGGSWVGDETYTATIDQELYEFCKLRRQRPKLSLFEICQLVQQSPETSTCVKDDISHLLNEFKAKRKANHDERERSRWNPLTSDLATQREILNFVEEGLIHLRKSLDGNGHPKP